MRSWTKAVASLKKCCWRSRDSASPLHTGKLAAQRRAASFLDDGKDGGVSILTSSALRSQPGSSVRHFLDMLDLSPDELHQLLEDTARLKQALRRGKRKAILKGKVLGLVFEKPSLRTRVSFEAGMAQLGGSSIYTNGSDVGFGKRESIADMARVMSEYLDCVVLRTFSHATVQEFAANSRIPVINGLSDA